MGVVVEESLPVWAVYDPNGTCEPQAGGYEMQIATLSTDNGDDHESAMPTPTSAADRGREVLRPTEICLCKSVGTDGVPRFSVRGSRTSSEKAVTKSDFDRHVLTGGERCERTNR